MADVELTPPEPDEFFEFRENYEMRKQYIDFMTSSLKNKYQKSIENSEWEIYLVAESKVADWLKIEEELELFEKTINE